jgi:hypothetical protein
MSGVLTTRKNLENERKRRRGNNKKHCCSHAHHRSTISNLIAESFANGQWPIANGGQWRAATCLFKFLAFSRRGVASCVLFVSQSEKTPQLAAALGFLVRVGVLCRIIVGGRPLGSSFSFSAALGLAALRFVIICAWACCVVS